MGCLSRLSENRYVRQHDPMTTFLILVCFHTPDSPEAPQSLPFIDSAVRIEHSSLSDAVDLSMVIWTSVTRNGSSGFPRPSRSVFEATNPRHLQRLMAMKRMRTESTDASPETDSYKIFFVVACEDAFKRWEDVEINTALRAYERWCHSSDAMRSEPKNRECFFLRECERLAQMMNGEDKAPSTEKEKQKSDNSLRAALRRYPHPNTTGDWKRLLKAEQAAAMEDLELDSFAQYR